MARTHDNWERLVEAVRRREQLRRLSLEDSRSPSTRSYDSDFSFSSSSQSFRVTPSPLNPDLVKNKLLNERKKSGTGKRRYWKGLSIFSGFSFSFKKDYGREERELQWAQAQRTLHGLKPPEARMDEEAKRRAEIARLRELHTFKGHIESMLKMKGLNIDSLQHYYTV